MKDVIILRGPVGVGKSTISRIIQQKLGSKWCVINVDELKYPIPLLPDKSNRPERSQIAHEVSNFYAREMHRYGYHVVLEEMYKKPKNDSVVNYMKENSISYLKVFLSAPVEATIERNNNRSKVINEAEVRRHYTEIEAYTDDFVIDTTKYSAEEVAEQIIAQL